MTPREKLIDAALAANQADPALRPPLGLTLLLIPGKAGVTSALSATRRPADHEMISGAVTLLEHLTSTMAADPCRCPKCEARLQRVRQALVTLKDDMAVIDLSKSGAH